MANRQASIRPHSMVMGMGVTGLTVLVGLLIAAGFALAKFAVQNGVPVMATFYWQLLGASLMLMAVLVVQRQGLSLRSCHLRYYFIGGLLGVSLPQLLAYAALQHIPASLFTVIVTLSPLATFVLASFFQREMLPVYRLVGVLVGLTGISLATFGSVETGSAPLNWLMPALLVPFLLGVTNLYRNQALPSDVNATALAAGTLISQLLLLSPLLFYTPNTYRPDFDTTDIALLGLAFITALSYILTFIMQRMTDGLGFSQVGYFVTLGGVFIGATLFGEPIGVMMAVAIILLFAGLAISNGHHRFWFQQQRRKK